MSGLLTPFQQDVLKALSSKPQFKDFYLTGGTALSAFYLEHRESDDLDLFTENPLGVAGAEGKIKDVARSLGCEIVWEKRFETLFECSLLNASGEKLEMDFALDMPGRLQAIRPGKALGMGLDNILDISCNKLSALYERSLGKDFADIYFILHGTYSFEALWQKACQKYPGLDVYGMSMAFFKVKGVDKLPRMLKPLSLDELKLFFTEKAAELSKNFGNP